MVLAAKSAYDTIREKGTDRSQFFRGMVDKYTWQEVGSSFLPGELPAAFLWEQFEEVDRITHARMDSWNCQHKLLAQSEMDGILRRPIVPDGCAHNAHMYYVLLATEFDRKEVLDELKRNSIWAVFHYVPLHSTPAGKRFGRTHGTMDVTNRQSERLIRLPLCVGLAEAQQQRVVGALNTAVSRLC